MMTQRYICRVTAICFMITFLIIIYSTHQYRKTALENMPTESEFLQKKTSVLETDIRPLVVIGILSGNNNHERRDALRRTWIRTIQKTAKKLPFKIVYRFYLDDLTTETDKENKQNGDLIYLNVSDHGTRYRYGKKVYIMIKHMYWTYPDVTLGIRLDDDVFLCVPQMFNRLNEVMDKNLYYGWKWKQNGLIDEMCVVLGNNVIRWIAEQTLCVSTKCSNNMLIGTDFGSTSLRNWLKNYKNVSLKTDNERMNHINIPADSKDWIKYAVPDYCKNHIMFHKVKTTQFMNVMHKNNQILNENKLKDISVSGQTFSGERCRIAPIINDVNKMPIALSINSKFKCELWAVVTTVFAPSKAIKYIAGLHEWCLLVVADLKTPSEKQFYSMLGIDENEMIKFLSVEEQLQLYPLLSESIPFNSFARKNIGYMYAIHQKAKLIWDFDDDNVGMITKYRYSNIENYLTSCDKRSKINTMNPYPYSVHNDTPAWPRGFPLNLLKNQYTTPTICVKSSPIKIGVIQSLANGEADVDAIYRLTNYPFNFTTKPDTDKMLVLPVNIYAPFNAQATLWFPEAYKYLALPISVTGRVTDIWRSYIAEHFLYKNNLQIAFAPPFVYHNRTAHNLMGDFHAETPLYEQSGKLIELISSNDYPDLLHLYDDLYQRQYIEEDDLSFIRAWDTTFRFVSK